MSDADDMWLKLKDMRQLNADGIFFCKNDKGEKVVLLYHEGEKLILTCSVGDCDHGFDC